MTDRERLWRRILDEPADTTLRLVYADCLDEIGSPKCAARAELIRVQCELASGYCHTPTKQEIINRDS